MTTAIARNLEPPSGKTDHIEWDEDFPGFGIRLRVGRNRVSRMWVYQYDIAGRTRRITLGNVNAISIQDARKTAGELHAKIRLGRDPAVEKAENLLTDEDDLCCHAARLSAICSRQPETAFRCQCRTPSIEILQVTARCAAWGHRAPQCRQPVLDRDRKAWQGRRQRHARFAIGVFRLGHQRRPNRNQSGHRHQLPQPARA